MREYFNESRSDGRNLQRKWLINYYVTGGKTLLLGTSHPDSLIATLKYEFPNVPMRATEHGVLINEKSK